MDKATATQNAANAVATATQVINDYGDAPESDAALQAALESVTTALQHGATPTDLHTTRPA